MSARQEMAIHQNLVAGEWISGSERTINRNPSDLADVIGEYERADVHQVSEAVEAAKAASATWAQSSIQDRSDLLDQIGTALLDQSKDLGAILSREEGKILRDGVG